ncbi:peptide ligase PGM1-related protein [Streptomyces sp. NPDC048002]|uniref:preATP grasp domain-containing protein n=1 Tax=Streptomyces sp. NPDC048002 TaxID=3154344 RepID=UPI0033F00E84
MAKLIVSNQRTEEMVGDLQILSPEYREYLGNQAQRMTWSLQEGDVLVLPVQPSERFLDYVTGLLNIDRETVEVVVPPTGSYGAGLLSRDRLLNEEFLQELQRIVTAHGIREIFPFHFDTTIASMAKLLGLDTLTPGFGFLDQGGGKLLNSKAAFRALAAGCGVSVPEGRVCASQDEAEEYVWGHLLSRGLPAILKQDYHVAGFGNEVVSPVPGVEPVGALRTVVAADREELSKYFAERWYWLTDAGRSPVVVERYFTDSLPLCSEFHLTGRGVELAGHGAMRMEPVLNGHIWPAPAAGLTGFNGFLGEAHALCSAIHAMGYRGTVSVDAIVTPGRRILINEFNCRVSGSTHAYHIGERIVGPMFPDERVLVEQRRCTFPPSILERLTDSGLAYDPVSRTGVLVTVEDNSASDGYGEYCIAAESTEHAERLERALAGLLAQTGRAA